MDDLFQWVPQRICSRQFYEIHQVFYITVMKPNRILEYIIKDSSKKLALESCRIGVHYSQGCNIYIHLMANILNPHQVRIWRGL